MSIQPGIQNCPDQHKKVRKGSRTKEWLPGIFAKAHCARIYFAKSNINHSTQLDLGQNRCAHIGLLQTLEGTHGGGGGG